MFSTICQHQYNSREKPFKGCYIKRLIGRMKIKNYRSAGDYIELWTKMLDYSAFKSRMNYVNTALIIKELFIAFGIKLAQG